MYKQPKQLLGYRLYQSCQNNGWGNYGHLHLEIVIGYKLNAARRYDQQPSDYNLERLQLIRELGQSADYLDETSSDRIEIRWQSDKENWEKYPAGHWYAGQIESCPLCEKHIKIVAKLAATIAKTNGAAYDNPRDVIKALDSMGARRVFHDQKAPYGAWIFDASEDWAILDKAPWEKAAPIVA
jgi:hypothetical protein